MLKQRVITALVLAPVMVGGIFFLPQLPFELFIAFILVLAGWEWANLAGLTAAGQRWGYALAILLLVAGVKALGPEAVPGILLVALLFWLVMLGWVATFPRTQAHWGGRAVRAGLGVLVLVPTWVALAALKMQPQSEALILYLMLLVWGADVGAYFAGRAWGRAKLAPAVSPGKTRAGLYGGLATCVLLALAGAWYWRLDLPGGLLLLGITLFCTLVSVLGDLFESMLKRYRGIKDSSQLLPGHGGVLDRIDSLTAAAPCFALGTYLLEGSLY